MELFSPVLQGSYGYLVIFQILVVTSLFLLLLWLVVQRTRVAAKTAGLSAGLGAEPTAEHSEIIERVKLLEEENVRLNATHDEAKPLQDKIKFLESKLLEYEILQEEIGTLGTLKIENEKLKEHLVRVESELNALSKRPNTGTEEAVPHEVSDPLRMNEGEKPPAGDETEKVTAMMDEIEKRH